MYFFVTRSCYTAYTGIKLCQSSYLSFPMLGVQACYLVGLMLLVFVNYNVSGYLLNIYLLCV